MKISDATMKQTLMKLFIASHGNLNYFFFSSDLQNFCSHGNETRFWSQEEILFLQILSAIVNVLHCQSEYFSSWKWQSSVWGANEKKLSWKFVNQKKLQQMNKETENVLRRTDERSFSSSF